MPKKRKQTSFKMVVPKTFRDFCFAYMDLPREDKKRLIEFSAKVDELEWDWYLKEKERLAQKRIKTKPL
jgi:hypothetical protein